MEELVLGGATLIWIPLGFLASLWLKRRLFTFAWLAGGFIGPLVFFNLYWIHDYYLIALTPMAAAAVGIGLVWTACRWKWIVPPLLGAVLVVAWVTTLQRSGTTGHPVLNPRWGAPREAGVHDARSSPVI
jgi:hypothetical protein